MEEQRVDKWLWCARLFKTRTLAGDAVKSGRVKVNGSRAKPARTVHIGDAVNFRRPPYEFHLVVTGVSAQRVSASRLGELYLETEDSVDRREALAQSIKATTITDDYRGTKPTKKQRRDRDRLKRSL
jgi:ribosome-associated heat shock protein Hsp15